MDEKSSRTLGYLTFQNTIRRAFCESVRCSWGADPLVRAGSPGPAGLSLKEDLMTPEEAGQASRAGPLAMDPAFPSTNGSPRQGRPVPGWLSWLVPPGTR